jgi:Na+-transporting methylmalonyl-CoA/oxaloacetate decarboxylase gamma subunit
MMILYINTWSELLIGSVIGILVVFAVLAVLVVFFEIIQYFILSSATRKQVKSGKTRDEIIEISANEVAAISMALHLFFDDNIHDKESNIITIKNIERRYSPWNSKIYGLNNTIHR